MTEIWLPGFERVDSAHGKGGTMDADAEPKWVGHATQGYSKDPAYQAAHHPTPPQIWCTPPSHPLSPRRRIQIIPLNRSGFALKHHPGDPETNKAGAIQVEIEGYSVNFDQLPDDDPMELTDEDLDWLATEVVEPMCKATGVNPSLYYRTDVVTRMDWHTWKSYNGLCMHRNVPGNDHTDAPLDLAHISKVMVGNHTDPPMEEIMAADFLLISATTPDYPTGAVFLNRWGRNPVRLTGDQVQSIKGTEADGAKVVELQGDKTWIYDLLVAP